MIALFLLISILLEATITTLPLSLIIIVFGTIVNRRSEVFLLAFFAGLLLDVLLLRPIGFSSMFFVTVAFITLLYERKFETNTATFILFLSFISSLTYLLITGNSSPVLNSVIVSIFAGISFLVFESRRKKVKAYG